MLRGALAAALTPLRDAGEALDEDGLRALRRLPRRGRRRRPARPRDDRRGFPASHGAAACARRSSSSRPRTDACSSRCTAVRSRPGTPSSSPPTRRTLGADARCGDGPAVLHARRDGAARASARPRRVPASRRRSTSTSSRRAAAMRCRRPCWSGCAKRAPNFRGLKVSDTPWERFAPYLIEGLDIFVGPEALLPQGLAGGAVGAVSALASAFPGARRRGGARSRWLPTSVRCARRSSASRSRPRRSSWWRRRGVPIGPDVRRPLRMLTDEEQKELERWLESSSPVAGSVGACIAYHLALLGARDVVLAERAEIASGSTGKAMGGVRQQFSTAAEVRLAQESIAVLRGARRRVVPAGRLSLRRDDGRRSRRARGAAGAAGEARRAGRRRSIRARFPDCDTDDMLGAVFCATDGVADPPALTTGGRPASRRAGRRRCASTPMRASSSATCSSSRRARTPASSVSTCRSARSRASCSRPIRSRTCRTICRW